MSEKEIISTFKYVSRMKPEFMLSEITAYLKEEESVRQIYRTLEPLFFDMGIDVFAEENDFRIKRAVPRRAIELSEDEIKKNEEFFSSAGVSRKLERLTEQYIEIKTGKKWDDPFVIDKIRKAVLRQKETYWKEGSHRRISYEKGYSILGYLAYQFPVYFVQFQYLLYEMAKDGLLKDRMKILDIGSGPGTVSLAVTDFYNRLDDRKAEISSVELFDENIEAYNFLVPAYASFKSNITVRKPVKADLAHLNIEKLQANTDLIVFSNVLNEITDITPDEKGDIIKSLSSKLADDGSIIIIEPADKINSTELRRLSVILKKKGIRIYSPCSFIWSGECRLDMCWTFEQKKDINAPGFMRKLAACEEPYRYINTDIKYSYVILRKDKKSKHWFTDPGKSKFARMAAIEKHKNKRINIACSLMSGDLGDEKYRLYRLCDGSCTKAVYAVLPSHNLTEENEAITKAEYGTIIKIFNVPVKYNEANDSYNLLIEKSTIISTDPATGEQEL